MKRSANKKDGLVLVGVLWLAVILILITTVVSRSSRIDSKVTTIGADQLRCKWACRAGLERAVAVLNTDQREGDGLKDLWSDNEEDFNEVELDQCLFSVKVIDEAGKLNINTATKEQLMALPDMTEEIAESIIDWRDRDDDSRAAGAESGYYKNLPYGYKIRNDYFRTVREALLVKGVAPELLYGEDRNFNRKLDYNERDGDESPPADNGNEQLDLGWVEYLTCYSYESNKDASGSKRININNADEKELAEKLKIRESQAKWIVDNRPKDNEKYKSIADLINENSPKKAAKESETNSDQAEPMDLETFSSIVDKITVSDEEQLRGRVNINTASETVLSVIQGGDSSAESIAADIISYRDGLSEPMASIAEVMNVKSVDIKTFKKIAEYISVRSDVYAVRCFAQAQRGDTSGAETFSEAVIDRSQRPYKVLYWYQGATN